MSKATLTAESDGRYRVSGVLDAATAPQLLRESEERFPSGADIDLRIDLSGVQESDSAGLALLLEWLRIARKRKQNVRFANVPNQIAALARISEVEELIVPGATQELRRT